MVGLRGLEPPTSPLSGAGPWQNVCRPRVRSPDVIGLCIWCGCCLSASVQSSPTTKI